MTIDPVLDPDEVIENLEGIHKQKLKRKGGNSFRNGAYRTDQERLAHVGYTNARIDTCPTKPEHKNWVLRLRERQAEVGPQVRLSHTLQVERLFD